LDGTADDIEYSKISYDLSKYPWDKDVDATTKVRALVEKMSDVFGPVIVQLNPQARVLSATHSKAAGVPIAVSFADHSHLSQIEQFLDSRLHNGDEQLNGLSALPTGVRAQFPRDIIIGEYLGQDASKFAEWLSSELTKFSVHFPSFYCHIIESYGKSFHSDDAIDLQLNFAGEESTR